MPQEIFYKADKLVWKKTPFNGINMAVLNVNDIGGGSVLLKMASGAIFPLHNHPGGEEVFVIYGKVIINQHQLDSGDFLYTPSGKTHSLKALEDSLLFTSAPKGIELVKA